MRHDILGEDGKYGKLDLFTFVNVSVLLHI